MTDDDKELVGRLRGLRTESDCQAAADRIEELNRKVHFEANYWHEEWVTQEAEARNAERERDALKARCEPAEALLRKIEAWLRGIQMARLIREEIRAHLASLDQPARDPRCNCPLPYRYKVPEEHEESCPVVAQVQPCPICDGTGYDQRFTPTRWPRPCPNGCEPPAPSCEYCGTTEGLRLLHDTAGYAPQDYVCSACFTPADDGPCFDDLPEAKPKCKTCGGAGLISVPVDEEDNADPADLEFGKICPDCGGKP